MGLLGLGFVGLTSTSITTSINEPISALIPPKISYKSTAFSFNEKSQRLQQKFASKAGTRKYNFYAYGRLWNSDFYVVDLLDRYGSNQGDEAKRFCK